MGVCETKSEAVPTPKSVTTSRSVALSGFSNPYGIDVEDDAELVISRRKLNRLVAVAAKTAGRFSRAGIDLDPLIWMHFPSDHLEGLHPIDACLELKHFETAMLFDEASCNSTPQMTALDVASRPSRVTCRQDGSTRSSEKMTSFAGTKRLYTATIVDVVGCQYLHVFYASVAKNIFQVAEGLRHRFGKQTADLAIIRPGFDPSDPIVLSLVSEALADMLVLVDAEPCSPLAAGLNIQFEARFDA